MLIKEKLLEFYSPAFKDHLNYFLTPTTNIFNIILVVLKLEKLEFCPVTSQNVSGRHIFKKRHGRNLNYDKQNLFYFRTVFFKRISVIAGPTL